MRVILPHVDLGFANSSTNILLTRRPNRLRIGPEIYHIRLVLRLVQARLRRLVRGLRLLLLLTPLRSSRSF